MFSNQTYSLRRKELRNKMQSGIIIILGNNESPANYPHNTFHFRQDSSFLYYFGLNQPGFVGVIDVDNDQDCIFADDFTLDDVIWMGKLPSVAQLAEQVGVKISNPINELQNVVDKAAKAGRKIHFLPPYRTDNKILIANLLGVKISQVAELVSPELVNAVIEQREIKSEEEIQQITLACNTGYNMHTTAMKMCKPGMVEREIMGTLEGISLKEGAGVSFAPIVTINGQTLHNHFYGNTLTDGRMLLVDAGAENNMNYCSDFTRTMPVNGKFTTKQKEIYDVVLSANMLVKKISKAGLTYQDIHIESLKEMGRGLHELGLIKGDPIEAAMNGAVAMFMPHGLGHQMGLDVHDMEDLGEKLVGYDAKTKRSEQFGLGALRMGKTLRPGHVITDEPGIYFIPDLIAKWKNEKTCAQFIDFQKVEQYLDFGGIRLEDGLLITENGCTVLGDKHIPLTTQEVENEMAKSL